MRISPVRRFRAARSAQRGAALILLAAAMIVGVAAFMIGAIGRAAPTQADLDQRTAKALQAAKRALLGYVAQYAARTTGSSPDLPGRLPCPESLTSIGTLTEGQAASVPPCSNTVLVIGRLPWQTLGIDQLRDSDGEPLWYALSSGFRAAPINFGTPAQMSLDATQVVAIIIAPGKALNTMSEAGPLPPGCGPVNQTSGSRYASPLDPQKFFECATATVTTTGNLHVAGTLPWSNDRAVGITAAEWADAISGAVADRLQRQVAPALNDWKTTDSLTNWGISFLPYASAFSDPANNDLCGDAGVTEGMPPIAGSTGTGCSAWSGATITQLLGLLGGGSGCSQTGTALQCNFNFVLGVPPLLTARISATAPGAAGSFRAPITAANISVSNGTVQNFSLSLSPATGIATATFDVNALALLTPVTVTIPNLPDAALLADPRLVWFLQNGWARYTYYAVAPGATVNPAAACAVAGDPGCLIVNGLPAPNDDKRLVLALMGRALASQSQGCPGCNDVAQFLEAGNATTGDRNFASAAVSSSFNDRIAACPFQYTPQSGGPITLCN